MPVTTIRKSPGVYITELDAFPPSIVGVQTAVPVFIGYTERAEVQGKPVYFQPQKIRSMAEYREIFGGAFRPQYDIASVSLQDVQADPDSFDFQFVDKNGDTLFYKLTQTGDSEFNLFHSMLLFYENGGDQCYVVSVGDYTDQGNTPGGVSISLTKLEEGLTAAGEQVGPTMTVIPDAVLLPPGADPADPGSYPFATLTQKMLSKSKDLQDRVAILDVYGTGDLDQTAPDFNSKLDKTIQDFRVMVGTENLNYGMAYFPFLNTSIVPPEEVNYTYINPASSPTLAEVLTLQAEALYEAGSSRLATVEGYIADMETTTDVEEIRTLNQNLLNATPVLVQIENVINTQLGVLPPSGAMAGVFSRIDNTRGVWNAPANTSLTSVGSPTIMINNKMQEDLNVPLDGKAIDAIRSFVGRGTIVWGARTLDGNSNDWRYIQVRRTLIYIEQSVKTALNQFVFAANDGKTWVTVTSMISMFLQSLWSRGGLMGSSPSDAYTVECGLGSTMTQQDILEGYMVVQITVQMIHPAEFIELTFKQKMMDS